jgi:hypothetical protein
MTFVIKVRGARGEMRTDYECPVHGRYTATVQRDEKGDPPETTKCPAYEGTTPPTVITPGWVGVFRCDRDSELRICAPLTRVNPIEAVKGKSQKPERKTWTDTRNIAEGQPVYEWKEERAKVWEEKRKQDVYNFAREHNERVIGGD